ncbi:MAG: dihydrofolate reductase [Bacteroidaceae bacterium]|nr:dihydrofolate reductase [Bacteroidaceae bacterium]
MKPKVLITYNVFNELYHEILKDFEVIMPAPGVKSFKYNEVVEMIKDCDALLSMWNFPVDKQLLDAAEKLKIVANFAVGYDNIDVDEATSHGVTVANTPDPVTAPTADIAIGLMIDLMRKITYFDKSQRNGTYVKGLMNNLGTSLEKKQLGILGMGRIGKAVAKRAAAFGMSIKYHNRHRLPQSEEQSLGAEYVTIDELFSTSDVISINAPLTPATRHIVDAARLSTMKRTAFLINTARGQLIDEVALIEALRNGTIAGAGLDVYEFRDTVSKELLQLENTVLTPHIGTHTTEGRKEMAEFAARNIVNFFFGGRVARVNHIE